MPIYEYECPKCGRFDALQKMSEPALKTHDVCGSRVRKLMSASAFAFKGSGFYITDYKGRNPAAITGGPDPKADAKPEPKADAKHERNADAKHEPKPDAKDAKKDAQAKPAARASGPANKSAA